MTKKQNSALKNSPCPIANMLDIIGDKWSLLVVRDLYVGKQTYSELLDTPEQISTNILATRLKQLEAAGVIKKTTYQKNPIRYQYELTEKGRDLLPILNMMLVWTEKHLPNSRVVPKFKIE